MDFGSIAKMFDPPYGDIVKSIIATIIFTPLVASLDFNFYPNA